MKKVFSLTTLALVALGFRANTAVAVTKEMAPRPEVSRDRPSLSPGGLGALQQKHKTPTPAASANKAKPFLKSAHVAKAQPPRKKQR